MAHVPHPSFFWGVSTSAHQVEGQSVNDWEAFGRRPETKVQPAGSGLDHLRRYPEDLDIMRDLGLNAYRFSVEWARIEPTEGVFDEAALNHYRHMAKAARKRGIEPMVTLWHFSLPVWFAERGGWRSPQAAELFERFVRKTVEALKSEVSYWFTMNEPEIYISHAYVLGDYPPAQKHAYLYPVLVGRLIAAHKQAYLAIKEVQPNAQVGIAKDNFVFDPAPGWLNKALCWALDETRNYYFQRRTRHFSDLTGTNYYVRFKVDIAQVWKKKHPVLWDLGWGEAAAGLPGLLAELARRTGKPVIITENGTIDHDDSHRARYLQEITAAIDEAKATGIPVVGYLHWTFLDCFEWTAGYGLKFGLVDADREGDLIRTPKGSAQAYKEIIKAHMLSESGASQ